MLLLLLGFSSLSFATVDSVLFFQSSTDATITKGTTKNTFTITLNHPSDYVSYFTDRPVRKAGVISLSRFLSLWTDKNVKNNFSQNPPNVAINMVLEQGKEQNAVVEIAKPSFINNVISYQISTLGNQSLEVGKVKHLVLFFDDIPWNPGGF